MSRSTEIRALRKELLMLQAEQLRLALRQDIDALRPIDAIPVRGGLEWLESLSGILGNALPGRWGRWVSLGLNAWHLVRRLLRVAKVAAAAD